jgi:GNAT superfamily N-acetyltransferase
MTFWSGNSAAPTFWTTLQGWRPRIPGFLREGPPVRQHEFYTFDDGRAGRIRRLFGGDTSTVGTFLAREYGGGDWRLQAVERWIGGYLRDADVVALGLFRGNELVGTIFSVPIGPVVMSHGATLDCVRVIEGLAVDRAFRGTGVAGFLIKHADVFTHTAYGPSVHLWARELDVTPVFHTAISVATYGFTHTGPAVPVAGVTQMDYDRFEQLWTVSSPTWVLDGPCLVATQPLNRRRGLRVFVGHSGLAVISATERVSASGVPIYEIVWCGAYTDGVLRPAGPDLNFQQLLNGVACLLPVGGVLFGTTDPCGGGVRSDWMGWTVGTSGVHALYMYNYMPPAFGACRIHMIREEL